MPKWVTPWLSFSVLGFGIFLSIRPVFLLVRTALEGLSQPSATLIAAALGFSGVIYATRAGFRNLISSQEAQSKRDREARSDQWRREQELSDNDRSFERMVLAAALHGELVALLTQVHNSTIFLRAQLLVWEGFSKDFSLKETKLTVKLPLPTYKTPIFDSNIGKMGLLPPSIVSDIVTVFSPASMTFDDESRTNLFPANAAVFTKMLLHVHQGWSPEIVHVASRLSHLQGFIADDPGNLYNFRQVKLAESSTGI